MSSHGREFLEAIQNAVLFIISLDSVLLFRIRFFKFYKQAERITQIIHQRGR